jgi:DNA repair protein RecN (Recombination protein N)
MLKYLSVSNLAVINQLQIEFRKGLNILSGETGSGKSIVIDAVGLLLGERASTEMIRTGENTANVEGICGIEGNVPLLEMLNEAGIVVDDDELFIKREIQATGRSRIFINNQSATLSLLKKIQPHLVDIHGQGDQQSLLSAETHLRLLDAYARAEKLQAEASREYELLVKLLNELDASRRTESERLQMLDLLEYQIEEIDRAALRPGEDIELDSERRVLANVGKLAGLCAESYGYLYEDEQAILTRLALIQKRLTEISDVDERFNAQIEQLESAKYALEELSYFIRDYMDNIEVSPECLKQVEDRLVELDRLKRKYGGSLENILEQADRMKLRCRELQDGEENEKALVAAISLALERYARIASELSNLRKAKASDFEHEALQEMSEVALADSRFVVRFAGADRNVLAEKIAGLPGLASGTRTPGRYGYETAEFYFSANQGEDLRPISAAASGGELSRLMLVLKTITAPTRFPRTLIFDEVDSGIGGRVAEAVGHRLKRLANHNQVLCVTHQAQIARYADAHFEVVKSLNGDRTITRVRELTQSERVDELARMIGGTEITSLARKHARELLKTRVQTD